MKKSYFLLFVVGALLMSLVFAGCGGAKQTSNDSGLPEKDKNYVVKLGYYDCDHMTAACIAKDAGIFDKLGLKVEVTGNGKVPEAMAAGQMDVGYVGNTRMMRAFAKGAPIVLVANNHLGGSYYMVAANNIQDPKDLVGKKMGIGTDPEKNSSSWVIMAQQLGLPIEGKNYEVFNMAGDKDKYFAMKVGKLDGFITCDPWASLAEHEGAGHIVAMSGKHPDGDWGECCAYTMNQAFVKDHPELAKRMILSHVMALEYVYTKPVHSAEIFSANYKQPLEVALRTIWRKTVAEGRTLTWKMERRNWERQVAFENKLGTMEEKPNLDELLNANLLAQSGADDFDKFIKEKVDPNFPIGMSYEDWKKKAYQLEGKTM